MAASMARSSCMLNPPTWRAMRCVVRRREVPPYSSLIAARTSSTSSEVNSMVGWACATCVRIAAITSSSDSALVFQSQSSRTSAQHDPTSRQAYDFVMVTSQFLQSVKRKSISCQSTIDNPKSPDTAPLFRTVPNYAQRGRRGLDVSVTRCRA